MSLSVAPAGRYPASCSRSVLKTPAACPACVTTVSFMPTSSAAPTSSTHQAAPTFPTPRRREYASLMAHTFCEPFDSLRPESFGSTQRAAARPSRTCLHPNSPSLGFRTRSHGSNSTRSLAIKRSVPSATSFRGDSVAVSCPPALISRRLYTCNLGPLYGSCGIHFVANIRHLHFTSDPGCYPSSNPASFPRSRLLAFGNTSPHQLSSPHRSSPGVAPNVHSVHQGEPMHVIALPNSGF
jgi:hypothetical protein